ncbi:Protein lethal(2)essential for life [Strongyloides ratti]|uniref:Protein lethal(2)essential for life n=1 Tax=Strongyloides ratti TaxID=34506 RepID=A0A090LEJ8_STRRB|nr:Protein lethal(2)essential for life [Strongyloides ratti]CEF66573.1 Protein lethal(2)essential for life [Strongyloides ratti]
MNDRWMTPFVRDPLSVCPLGYGGPANLFNEMNMLERKMMNSLNMVDRNLTNNMELMEPCPEVVNNDKEFRVKMDVSHYGPNELKVTVRDNYLQVEGKHEEKTDKYGTIQRSFVRKYALPKGLTEENVKSELTKNGVLTVGGNKMAIEDKNVKTVPIEYRK